MFEFGKFGETEILLYYAKCFSCWQIMCNNLGQQNGDCERETGPPEESVRLEDDDESEGQYAGEGEEIAPDLAV